MKRRSLVTTVVATLALVTSAATLPRTSAATPTKGGGAVVGSLVVAGVDIPKRQTFSGRTLQLNGVGVRTVKFALVPIKAYVAAFYAPKPLRSEEAVMDSPGPFLFDFSFLQEVSGEKVTKAWNAQFKASNTHSYDGYEGDKARFVALFGPLAKGGIVRIVIDGTKTRTYENGRLKGSVEGRDFQQAFLSLWFGSKPVMPSLEKDLLGI